MPRSNCPVCGAPHDRYHEDDCPLWSVADRTPKADKAWEELVEILHLGMNEKKHRDAAARVEDKRKSW